MYIHTYICMYAKSRRCSGRIERRPARAEPADPFAAKPCREDLSLYLYIHMRIYRYIHIEREIYTYTYI